MGGWPSGHRRWFVPGQSPRTSFRGSLEILGIGLGAIIESQWVDNGPGWVAVMLESAEAVLALRPSPDRERFDIGIVGMYPHGSECAYEVRAIFSGDHGAVVEDPVTGSLNASLAQWLVASGRISAPYTVSQGTALLRTGRPRISADEDGLIWVGGETHTAIEGTVDIG